MLYNPAVTEAQTGASTVNSDTEKKETLRDGETQKWRYVQIAGSEMIIVAMSTMALD